MSDELTRVQTSRNDMFEELTRLRAREAVLVEALQYARANSWDVRIVRVADIALASISEDER